jgi:hypothetical protein
LALSYDVDKERKGGDTLSDLDLNLRLRPTSYLTLGFDGGVNPGPWQITQTRTSFVISDPRPITRLVMDPDFNRPNSLSLYYHFLRRGPNSLLAENANIDLDLTPTPAYCAGNPLDPRCPVGTEFNKNVVGNIGANLLYKVTDNALFYFSSTYDARDNRFIGFRAITKLLSFCECGSVTLGVRKQINPAKTTFDFSFNLLGLGGQRTTLE